MFHTYQYMLVQPVHIYVYYYYLFLSRIIYYKIGSAVYSVCVCVCGGWCSAKVSSITILQ